MSYIDLTLQSTQDWSAIAKCHELANILLLEDDFLLPQKFDQREPERYVFDATDLSKLNEIWLSKLSWPRSFKRNKPYPVWMEVEIRERGKFNKFSSGFDERYFKKEHNVPKVLSFAKRLYGWGGVIHGYICHSAAWDMKNYFGAPTKVTYDKRTSTGGLWLQDCLPGIYWANFFGPPYVSFFGREKFLSVPAYQKEELSDGGFLLLTSSSPFDYVKSEVRKLELEIMDHLGRDAFFDRANPEKPLRAPKFTFEQAASEKSLTTIEYDPITHSIPDINKFLGEAVELSKALVYRLAKKLDYTPESLLQIDDYILKKSADNQDPWTKEDGRRLLQELTAYYGEVLARNFNGKWLIQESSGGDRHPVVSFTVNKKMLVEYPFVRISKLWLERQRPDGLAARYHLLRTGQLSRVEDFIKNLDK